VLVLHNSLQIQVGPCIAFMEDLVTVVQIRRELLLVRSVISTSKGPEGRWPSKCCFHFSYREVDLGL
jgi:hypothetical protein